MKLAARYLLTGLALVALAALGLLWVLRAQAERQTVARAADRLARVPVVAADLRDAALQQLQLRAAALASDPAFVDYVVQSMQPGAAADGGVDRASIVDLLKSRRSGYDLAAVLDPQGRPVAVDGTPAVAGASLSDDPLVTRTLATLKPSSGAWVHQGKLLWVAVNPLLRGGIAQGLLLTAARVDDGYAAAVSRHTGAAVAVLTADDRDYRLASSHALSARVASTLPNVAAALPAPDALTLPDSELKLPDGHGEIARVMPLATSSGRAVLVAMTDPAADRPAATWPALALALLGALAVLWHWWRVQRPLQQLADRVGAAANGRRPPEFVPHGGLAVRRLARRLNRLFARRHDA